MQDSNKVMIMISHFDYLAVSSLFSNSLWDYLLLCYDLISFYISYPLHNKLQTRIINSQHACSEVSSLCSKIFQDTK